MRKTLFTLALVLMASFSFAQQNFLSQVSESSINKNLFANWLKPPRYILFHLQEAGMKTDLGNAPSEKIISASASSFIITVPVENGKFERFSVVDAPVMDEALAAKYPGIRSYAGQGIDDPSSTIRFDMSPLGFHGMILSPVKSTVYIDPIDHQTGTYILVVRKDVLNYPQTFQCLTKEMNSLSEGSNASNDLARNAAD